MDRAPARVGRHREPGRGGTPCQPSVRQRRLPRGVGDRVGANMTSWQLNPNALGMQTPAEMLQATPQRSLDSKGTAGAKDTEGKAGRRFRQEG